MGMINNIAGYHCHGCQEIFTTFQARADHQCRNKAVPEDYINQAVVSSVSMNPFAEDNINKLVDIFFTKHPTMTQMEYLKRFEQVLGELLTTTTKKNADYAEAGNAFANFNQIEDLTAGRIKTADGIFVRMTDKVKRIASLLGRPNAVDNESIIDSLNDLAVYSIIMRIWLENVK